MSNSENNHPHETLGINTLKRDSVIRLVDDDPSVLRALTTFLEMDDWQVRCFKSGIDFLHSPGKETGCVILDVRMPGLSGLEVQDLMKKNNESSCLHEGDIDFSSLNLNRVFKHK